MKRTLLRALPLAAMALTLNASAQRYLNEVFTNAQLTLSPNVIFGTNIDFLTSDFSDMGLAVPEIIQLQTAVSQQQPIPSAFFDPQDPSTVVKVANLRMDVYEPNQVDDNVTDRPLFVYIHTGNALPPPFNGSPNGTRKDSTCVEICSQMARRGYVAVSMSYRGGWNPLGATLEERRGTLLNAIYRAIHDVKQCVRTMKADAAVDNTYHINPDKVILFGEGTGGYIALATSTLDQPAELYIEKFLPDPFDPTTSYVDSTLVGNIEGFGGQLCLYRPNGQNSEIDFCVNMGGALADTSWLAPGDAPMVAFHTVFDPFAPFTEGIVIVPTTQEQVVPVQGSNLFMQMVNDFGNNNTFIAYPSGDPWTDRARSLYGTTQTHTGSTVNIYTGVEGLFPIVTPDWPSMVPGTMEEASPWQWWDPNSPLAQTVVAPPDITAHQASMASNPNMSPDKGRAMIDSVMGYMNPRIVCALQLGACPAPQPDCLGVVGGPDTPGAACDDGNANTINDTWTPDCLCLGVPVGIEESEAAQGLTLMPNPVHDVLRVSSERGAIIGYTLYDATGREVRQEGVNAYAFTLDRTGLQSGAYLMTVRFNDGIATRRITLD